ncbi:MAG TPA: hypothetical protein VJ891_18340, partial [Casimicrobiaceae bacterium]|nr:hypothetical protein [Casimicrobiaceae bacterium]
TLATWLSSHENEPDVSRDYVARMFQGLAGVPAHSPSSFAALAAEFKTKGGLNEQFANELAAKGAFAALTSALDNVLARIGASERAP